MVQPLCKNSVAASTKLNKYLPLLGFYPREMKTYPHKIYVHECYCGFIHNCPQVTQMFISWWMDKLPVIHSHSKILSNKKKWTTEKCNFMHVECIMISKKKARLKGLYSITFHVYDILESAGCSRNRSQISSCQGLDWRGRDWLKGAQGNYFWPIEMFYILIAVVVT